MPNSGTLITRVFTGRAQIPVEGATVSILQREPEGRLRLLAVRVTDSSGRIEPVTIAAPDAIFSLVPGTNTPFAECDVWTEHPQFQILEVRNTQIFPDINSIQDLPLMPLNESRNDYMVINVVNITPQPL